MKLDINQIKTRSGIPQGGGESGIANPTRKKD
jgi:hypothetical protein